MKQRTLHHLYRPWTDRAFGTFQQPQALAGPRHGDIQHVALAVSLLGRGAARKAATLDQWHGHIFIFMALAGLHSEQLQAGNFLVEK